MCWCTCCGWWMCWWVPSVYAGAVGAPPAADILLASEDSERRGNDPTVISDSAKSLRKQRTSQRRAGSVPGAERDPRRRTPTRPQRQLEQLPDAPVPFPRGVVRFSRQGTLYWGLFFLRRYRTHRRRCV